MCLVQGAVLSVDGRRRQRTTRLPSDESTVKILTKAPPDDAAPRRVRGLRNATNSSAQP
jgi:hypothetical protein